MSSGIHPFNSSCTRGPDEKHRQGWYANPPSSNDDIIGLRVQVYSDWWTFSFCHFGSRDFQSGFLYITVNCFPLGELIASITSVYTMAVQRSVYCAWLLLSMLTTSSFSMSLRWKMKTSPTLRTERKMRTTALMIPRVRICIMEVNLPRKGQG